MHEFDEIFICNRILEILIRETTKDTGKYWNILKDTEIYKIKRKEGGV
jgi:hypothetical protein